MTQLAEPEAPAQLVVTEADGAVDAMALPTRRIRQRRWVGLVAGYLVTLFVLITFNFALPRLMPADPIDALMAFGSPSFVDNAQTRADLAKYYHLDESIPQQYVHYLGRMAHGDLGRSIYNNRPVRADLGGRLAWTFLLIITATLVSILIGIPLGIKSGWKRGKRVDRRLLGFFLAYQNLPIIVVGAAGFLILSAKLHLFPYGGASTPFNEYTGFAQAIDVLRHLALPALLLGLDMSTFPYLIMRSSMVSELGSDYLLGGRAKGLKERRLKYRYAGRNAMLPVVSVLGLQFALSITGVILIERIFAYPGVGTYMFNAIGTRDYPAMQGAFLILAFIVVTVNLAVDLLYRRIDPRTAA